jgi:hypothetical protein
VASYPELGCSVRGEQILEMIEELELQRVHVLVEAVKQGRSVVPLRAPLADNGVEQLLARAGLEEWIPRLDEQVRSSGGDQEPSS